MFAKAGKRFWGFMRRLKRDNSGIAPLRDGSVLHVNSSKKAEILNKQYCDQFTDEDLSSVPEPSPSSFPSIPFLTFGVDGVYKLLNGINPNKAQGPDELPAKVLKELAFELAPALTKIFESSYETGDVPPEWKQANVAPIYKGKNSNKSDAANYRPVSLTCICSKLFEHCITKSILKHCATHGILTDAQHGFRERRSCETQLLTLTHDLARDMAGGGQVDLILLDFSKAFDKVPHQRLLYKLRMYGIDGKHAVWIENFLTDRTQKVVVEGTTSAEAHVKSGVPQGTVLGPVLFLIFINDLPPGVSNSLVRLFADDAAIYRPVKSIADCQLLQDDLDQLLVWEEKWQMSFHPGKCKVMRFTRATDKLEYVYDIRGHFLEVVSAEKYLGVKLDDKLSWNAQVNMVTGKAKGKLGFLRRNLKIHNQSIKETAYKCYVRSTLEYCATAWDPHLDDHVDELEKVQRAGARYVTNRYKWNDSPTEMMSSMKWESLKDRRTKSKLCMTFKILNDEVDIPEHKYFSPKPKSGRVTRSSVLIEQSKHSRALRETDSTIDYVAGTFFHSVQPYWNELPPSVAEATTLASFKSQVSKEPLQRLLPCLFPAGSEAP